MTHEVIMAGFGGQGILFAGKILAYAGMLGGFYVSWLPSYGPEMRGGTANCHIIISDSPVGSPIITKPDSVIAMNMPSLDKFEDIVKTGGNIIVDSTLIDRKIREDVNSVYIPASKLANEMQASKLANMIILGKFFAQTNIIPTDIVLKAIEKNVPAAKAHLFELNKKAISIGMEG